MRKIWITWEIQRRNRTLSKELGVKLYEVVVERNFIVRYIASLLFTLRILYKENPDIVFAQNPSIVLATFCLSLRPFFKYKLVIDEHNAGIFPIEGKSKILNYIAMQIATRANLALVTNESLYDLIKRNNGHPFIIQDPLPHFDHDKPKHFDIIDTYSNTFNIMYISSWSKDEPVEEVFKASLLLDPDVKIFITGKNRSNLPTKRFSNVVVTGFLTDEDYISLLHWVDLVMVLTYRDNCLNCGSYEAVSAEKPMISSDKDEIRKYFSKGVVYTKNNSNSIANSILSCRSNISTMKVEVKELKRELRMDWKIKQTQLSDRLNNLI